MRKNLGNNKGTTVDQLARMVADGFADTKDDIAKIREEMATKAGLATLRGDMDMLFERHIGTFRRDYDALAHRVKKIEEAVFRRK